MEVKITISDTTPGSTAPGIATPFAGTGMPTAGMPGNWSQPSGAPSYGAGAPGMETAVMTPGAQVTSPVHPPAELARAAAAMGAHSAGPAPMWAASMGGSSGEPAPFTGVGSEAATLAGMGAPDTPAGAAPGAERTVPTVRVEEAPQNRGEG